MTEQLISFETAKLAKEKGFTDFHAPLPSLIFDEKYMPTQSLLQKWLREEHNLYTIVIPNITVIGTWNYYVEFKNKANCDLSRRFFTYEEALEKGLQEALKLI